MDGLALLRAVLDVRSDVRMVVNELLMHVGSLADHFLPFDMFAARPRHGLALDIPRTHDRQQPVTGWPVSARSARSERAIQDNEYEILVRGRMAVYTRLQSPVFGRS